MSFHPRDPEPRRTPRSSTGKLSSGEAARKHWSGRWAQLAMGAGLAPTEPVLLALSGGADSVYLLTALAKAEPRPRVLAVHVDHRLRGDESREDAAFCARTCAKLGIPFSSREVEVDPEGPNLEARAREARYKALALEARNAGLTTILTGHHEDDALETLLLRWMRGSALPGLAGLKARNILGRDSSTGDARSEQLTVVRPLLSMRREEVRRLLRDSGMDWREDSSNESPRFTRNRVRNELMPEIAETCGEGGFENLRAFASAVESLEEELAARTAHLSWELPPYAGAVASVRSAALAGGTLRRTHLTGLAAPLQRRALWRLLTEGTGQAPTHALIAILQDDLARDHVTTRTLPGGWQLDLRADELVLSPGAVGQEDPTTPDRGTPDDVPGPDGHGGRGGHGGLDGRDEGSRSGRTRGVDPALTGSPSTDVHPTGASRLSRAPREHSTAATSGGPEEPASSPAPTGKGIQLTVPGTARLSDGREIHATILEEGRGAVSRDPLIVELRADRIPDRLEVRTLREGDRFHALGAPGSKPLRRFLADAGVPRALRGNIPLVCDGQDILWVAGIRPAEAVRIHDESAPRLRLELWGSAAQIEDPTDLERPPDRVPARRP